MKRQGRCVRLPVVCGLAAAAALASVLAAAPPVAVAQQGAPYADVPAGTFYSEAVAALAAEGVFEGTECEDGFCPGEDLDRATMAVWTVRVLDGEDPEGAASTRFADVDGTHPHAAFIERLTELDVTAGCGDGTNFCPDTTVTRAQMAVFLSRAFDLAEGPDPGFGDVAPDAWHAADIAKLAASEITAGCGDGTNFCPDTTVTRAQMATFLHRAMIPDSPEPRIAFTRLEGFHLMVMNADGTEPHRLTPGVAWNAVWSPDGSRLAYHSKKGQGIWVVNADGTGRQQLHDRRWG